MKKVSLIVATLFLMVTVLSSIGFAQPPGGKKGGKKGPPPKISHEDFVKMYDRDGNGEVSMDEFLQGPKGGPPSGKSGKKGPQGFGPSPGGKKGGKGAPPGGKKGGPPTFISPYPAGSAENEILQVVATFDKAFNSNNYELMSSVWWHSKKISRFAPGPPGAFLAENWKLFDLQFKARAQRQWNVSRMGRYNSKVTLLDDDTAIATSYINLRRAPPNQASQIDYTRSTLVFQKIKGKWLIAHMHNSNLPE